MKRCLDDRVPADRAIILHQRWNPIAPLLVTGTARMDAFRQSGESLAGRFFGLRLHPISVREWCEQTEARPMQRSRIDSSAAAFLSPA